MTGTLKLGLAGLDHLQGNQWFGGEWNPFFAVLWVMIVMYRAVVKFINAKFNILKLKLLVFKRLEKCFKVVKVARWKKRLCICSHHAANLNFLFLSLCVYLFKNCPSQFLSHWESAEPVFCSDELIGLPCKNKNKSLTLSYLVGNSNLLHVSPAHL